VGTHHLQFGRDLRCIVCLSVTPWEDVGPLGCFLQELGAGKEQGGDYWLAKKADNLWAQQVWTMNASIGRGHCVGLRGQ
jgi:hypothetical protein